MITELYSQEIAPHTNATIEKDCNNIRNLSLIYDEIGDKDLIKTVTLFINHKPVETFHKLVLKYLEGSNVNDWINRVPFATLENNGINLKGEKIEHVNIVIEHTGKLKGAIKLYYTKVWDDNYVVNNKMLFTFWSVNCTSCNNTIDIKYDHDKLVFCSQTTESKDVIINNCNDAFEYNNNTFNYLTMMKDDDLIMYTNCTIESIDKEPFTVDLIFKTCVIIDF